MANNKIYGRGERIRTSDSCVTNAVLYQAELHPELPSMQRRSPAFYSSPTSHATMVNFSAP